MGIVIEKLREGHYIRYAGTPLVRVPARKVKGTDWQTIYIRKYADGPDPVSSGKSSSNSIKSHKTSKIDVGWL